MIVIKWMDSEENGLDQVVMAEYESTTMQLSELLMYWKDFC